MSRPFGTLSRYTFSRRSTFKQLYFALLDRPALRRVEAIHFTTEAERTEADRPTVLFMSRLHPKKNVRGLLHAWTRVVEQRPDAQLWVAGDGDEAYVHGLHHLVADRPVGSRQIPRLRVGRGEVSINASRVFYYRDVLSEAEEWWVRRLVFRPLLEEIYSNLPPPAGHFSAKPAHPSVIRQVRHVVLSSIQPCALRFDFPMR